MLTTLTKQVGQVSFTHRLDLGGFHIFTFRPVTTLILLVRNKSKAEN